MDDKIPLIVPEVNPEAINGYKNKNIIANPNCSTIQLVVALKPIHKKYEITRVVVSTYQAVSRALDSGPRTQDIMASGRVKVGTKGMMDSVINKLEELTK